MTRSGTQVLFPSVGRIQVRDVEVPDPRGAEILLAIRRVGICATDLHLLEGHIGDPFPLVPGHEFVGEIVALGPDARQGWRPGDHVTVEMLVPCGGCSRCREGRYNLCEQDLDPEIPAGRQLGINIPATTGSGFTGGYATHLLVPPEAIMHRLPDDLDWDVAALVEPLAVSFHALARGRVGQGDQVLVIGPGPVGLLICAAARSVGARVTVAGTRPSRLEAARRFGADDVVNTASGDALPRADVVIEAAGTPLAQASAIRAVRRGGRVVLAGACGAHAELTIDPDLDLLTREVDVLPSFLSSHGYRPAIDLLARGSFPFVDLVTHRFALNDVDAAFAAVRDREQGVLKAVLMP